MEGNMIKALASGLLCAYLCAPGVAMALPEGNTIEFSNCTLEMPGTTVTALARCGTLEVPENPDQPDGRQISLRVAMAPAVARSPEPDPLFLFAGGPGQAASETWVMMRPILDKIRRNRDIVMIDQRGTGQSAPMDCDPGDDSSLEPDIDMEQLARLTTECLESQTGDPRFYTTTVAMHDYELVRQAMGYGQINLLGISYGTRSAQVYMRQYPLQVRSAILDSVVPMQLNLSSEHAPMLDRAVNVVFDQCHADESCREKFPEGMAELSSLVQELRAQPREIHFIHPLTGEQETLEVNGDILAVAIRFLNYGSETQALMPLLTHEAVSSGRLDRLAAQAMLVMSGLSETLSRGMELSVICSEDYPFMSGNRDHTDTLLGNIMSEVLDLQCGIWPRGEVPDDFHEPLVSNIPVLLMSGERDPVTPPAYAATVAESLQNHLNLVAKGRGHAVIKNHCMRGIATDFVESADPAEVDTSCVEKILPSPFFTSLLGPNP
jgi:pimeloyl-ACP methyl ester carboxylesterase